MPRIALLSFAAILSAGAAQAQPSRIGNVYDGTHHQPTPSGVAGLPGAAPEAKTPPVPPPGNNNAVDPLGAKLLHDENVDPPRSPQRTR